MCIRVWVHVLILPVFMNFLLVLELFSWCSIFVFCQVATKSNSAYNMMNGVRVSGHPGGAIVSAQYLKNEMSDLNETWYIHARW